MEISNNLGTGDYLPESTEHLQTKTPEELRDYVVAYHDQFKQHISKGFKYGLTIGFILAKMRNELPMREYAKFRDSTGIPRRTAYNYIFMFENRDRITELLDKNFSLNQIFKIINNKEAPPPEKKKLPSKQLLLFSEEQKKQRREKRAFTQRLRTAHKTKSISANDREEAIKREESKIEESKNKIEVIKSYRVKK